jgi:hypothetical protein
MNDSHADELQTPTTMPFFLPPMFSTESGKRTSERLGKIDFDLMGYVLSCHLLVEHYMDEYLKAFHPELEWEAAKPTFAQREALLGRLRMEPNCNPVPVIKHLNALRNKFGHRLNYTPSSEDMQPFVAYIQGITPDKPFVWKTPKEVLHLFTWMCCVAFDGLIRGLPRIRQTRPDSKRRIWAA